MKRAKLIAFLILQWWSGACVHAQSVDAETKPPFSYEILYTGDWMHNLRGGIATGSAYLGMANVCLGFDLNAAGLTHAGSFFLKASKTHGATPSQSMIGDFQVASNIEAGDHTYLQELWYEQPVGDVVVILGLQDMNVRFAANQHSGIYMNSSFGVHPTISHNTPAPIFPLTSLGVTASWTLSENWRWESAVYDGCPKSFETNPYNLKWHIRTDEGVFAITELQYSSRFFGSLEGVYKIGLYDHTRLVAFNEAAQATETLYRDNYGVYATMDQVIAGTKGAAKSIALFARAGLSPKHPSLNEVFLGGGINYYGAWREEGDDVLGAAFAYASMEGFEGETAIELTYQRPLTQAVFIQPDVQYILHPAGTGVTLDNSIAVTLRFGIHL